MLVEANSSYSNDLGAAIQTAVNAGAKYVSNSYGAGEYSVDPYFNRTFPGVALVASTGDNGTYASGVNSYPAAIPGIIAAGGTSLALSGGSPDRARLRRVRLVGRRLGLQHAQRDQQAELSDRPAVPGPRLRRRVRGRRPLHRPHDL